MHIGCFLKKFLIKMHGSAWKMEDSKTNGQKSKKRTAAVTTLRNRFRRPSEKNRRLSSFPRTLVSYFSNRSSAVLPPNLTGSSLIGRF
ncbi:unnamed protein product [Lactuca virosa]|uniref:Uncharacterized protein n=1 Tax=Lactuca virosa TaxID=75947 RepID=A0AAU9PK61_9ASTR|nr:unnamed protein product [Lactuca virosa]